MTSALRKYDWLSQRGQWGVKSPDDEKIVAMAEGLLKANKNLKTRSKINRGDKTRQKEDEMWKKIPPKDGDNKKSKEMGKYTFHWCEHHMAWCMHLHRKKEQSPVIGSNSTTYATAAASIANPQFQTLIVSMTGLQGRVNED